MIRNPLHYDLTSLDLSTLKKRMFRTYLKDRRATIAERQEIAKKHKKGRKAILPRPRKDTIQKWLPNHQVYVYPTTEFSNYEEFMYGDLSKLTFKNGTPLLDVIKAAQAENGFVVVADIESLQRFTDGDQFTPFMMLHDVGESLIEDFLLGEELYDLNPFGWGFSMGIKKDDQYFKLALPNMQLLDMLSRISGYGKQIPIGVLYMDDDSNAESDLFAMYCKKERLTVDDFIWVGSKKYIEYYNHPLREEERGGKPSSTFPTLTLKQKKTAVDYYNMLFSEALKLLVTLGVISIR